MCFGGRRAANQQWQVNLLSLEFRGYSDHLIERRRDQATQPNDVDLFFYSGFDDFIDRYHDAEINDIVVVTLEHDTNNVLAYIVHVTFDRCH